MLTNDLRTIIGSQVLLQKWESLIAIGSSHLVGFTKQHVLIFLVFLAVVVLATRVLFHERADYLNCQMVGPR